MKRVKDDFDKRKSEINRYFKFLSNLDKDVPKLNYREKGVYKNQRIDAELLKILKANGFLLIYNLVESFCRNSLLEILISIENEMISLKDLSEQAQKLWITQNVKDLKEAKDGKIIEQFHTIAINIIEESTIDFKNIIEKMKDPEKQGKDIFGLSGNIDARKIRELASMYGFESKLSSSKERAGADLLEIKSQRNQLAHGRITFVECGATKSVPQMIDYKNNAITYLKAILVNIETYINNSEFKK
jgi:hypothetical protein